MKTLIFYEAGRQLYYELLADRLPDKGDSVDLPGGRYDVVKRIFSPARFRSGATTVRRTGFSKLTDIVTFTHSGKFDVIADLLRSPIDLQKGGIIVPLSEKDDFDDLVYLRCKLVTATPEDFDQHREVIHSMLAKPQRTAGAAARPKYRQRPRFPGKVVLTDKAKE